MNVQIKLENRDRFYNSGVLICYANWRSTIARYRDDLMMALDRNDMFAAQVAVFGLQQSLERALTVQDDCIKLADILKGDGQDLVGYTF